MRKYETYFFKVWWFPSCFRSAEIKIIFSGIYF